MILVFCSLDDWMIFSLLQHQNNILRNKTDIEGYITIY